MRPRSPPGAPRYRADAPGGAAHRARLRERAGRTTDVELSGRVVVEHHVARAVSVLLAEQLGGHIEEARLIGGGQKQLLRAPHEKIKVRTWCCHYGHLRRTLGGALTRAQCDER